VLILAVIALGGGFANIRGLSAVNFGAFFNHLHLDALFVTATGLAALGALVGVMRFWKGLSANPILTQEGCPNDLVAVAVATLREIFTHAKFRQCESSSRRFWAHICIFYGFVGMFLATSLAFLLFIVGAESPFSILHPVKILGNGGGAVFLVGWAVAYLDRLSQRKDAPLSAYADWLFVGVIGATVITGFLSQGLRIANTAALAYPMYYLHLVLVFFLLVYLPYSKFAHLLYRTVAVIYARYACRQPDEPSKSCAAA
jgi:quinone-modifying oxidoreductase subunit QmoC